MLPPSFTLKSKVQLKKNQQRVDLSPLSLHKTEKRSLSPPLDSLNEKNIKISLDIKKSPYKILKLIFCNLSEFY